MKRTYTAELYCRKGEHKKLVEVQAFPEELERIAREMLHSKQYVGVRFLREEYKQQVVEIVHYRNKRGVMVRAVWQLRC